jgi:hypothetical protein
MSTAKKRRHPNLQLIRTTQVYTVKTLAETLERRPETVLRWIKDGMPVLDGRKPYLVDASEAKEWLAAKWARRKTKCALDELYCLPCHAKKHPSTDSAKFIDQPNGTLKIEATCPDCGGEMHITRSGKDKDKVRNLMSRFTANVQHLSGYRNPAVNRVLDEDSIQPRESLTSERAKRWVATS